ncbi:class I SAM-dependent methyltransferase [Hoeflea sp. G2-23]|uniref:Class I SAM-dependent methyltransferase n=1 Tax=Hoeflea algicola TaxID=2983763 RepID=A0ABT3Z579_9HYPH|nr:class I SAM-dependent methyltransferase [Hoeflea algicola]MCY0146539.1 class I SAM-dependent methyltransferase [Hoeflea algicola]
MAQDDRTLKFYGQEAIAYTSRCLKPNLTYIEAFLSALPVGSVILELGCGAGQDSEFMISRGFDVRPTDGTFEIARAAEKRLGIPVANLLFADMNEEGAYDGIWAHACLLHVPRADLPGVLAKIRTALKDGGLFYASFKAGETEGRDRFDRYYNYPSERSLREWYMAAGWAEVEISAEIGGGYDQMPTDWLHVTATK